MAKSYFYDESIADWRELVKGEQGERGPVGPRGPQGPAIDIETGLPISVDTTVGTRVFVGDVMVHGDTGWLDISGLLDDSWALEYASHFFEMRRENDTVTVRARLKNALADERNTVLITPPEGFRVTQYGVWGNARIGSTSFGVVQTNASTTRLDLTPGAAGGITYFAAQAIYWTPDAWPDSLPGTPA